MGLLFHVPAELEDWMLLPLQVYRPVPVCIHVHIYKNHTDRINELQTNEGEKVIILYRALQITC